MNQEHQLYENAKRRMQQKRKVYIHFVIFLIGSAFFFVCNKVLHIGEDFIKNWYIAVFLCWFFLWVFHVAKVFVFNQFLGKEWKESQIERLIEKQKKSIENIEKEVSEKPVLENQQEEKDS